MGGEGKMSLISFDNANSSSINANTILTYSLTVSGNDRLLFVGTGISANGTPTVTSITYGGENLTFIRRVNQTGGAPDLTVEIWYKVAPLTGANDVVVTWDTTGDISSGAISLNGAHQTHTLNASNDSLTKSIDVTTTVPNCLVVDYIGSESAYTVNPSQTQRFQVGVNTIGAGSTKDAISYGTATMSWTGGGDDAHAVAAFASTSSYDLISKNMYLIQGFQ